MNEAHGPPPQMAAASPRANVIDLWFVRALAGLWLAYVIGALITVLALGLVETDGILSGTFVALLMACALMLVTTIVVGLPLRVLVNLAIPSRRQTYRMETRWLGGILFFLAFLMAADAHARWSLSPPKDVNSLEQFSARMPAPRWLEVHRISGRDYIAWYGETASLPALPSGPSCYVFDDRGQLIEWQPETGDGGPVERFLSESEREQKLSVEEALALTREN